MSNQEYIKNDKTSFFTCQIRKKKNIHKRRIMMNENGQCTLVGKKLEYARIQTSIVTTNMM